MDYPENPYQSPSAEQTGPPSSPEQRSGVPKVFGILHIIYAALGGLIALLGLGGGALMKAVFQEATKAAREEGQDISKVTGALDSLITISMVQSVVAIVFAALLLVAGIKLLKYQDSGRKLSNIWAISRIVVAIPLAFMAISAQATLQEEIQNLSKETSAIDMSAMAGVGGLIGVVLVCIYPVLSLIFLNKEKSKAALK